MPVEGEKGRNGGKSRRRSGQKIYAKEIIIFLNATQLSHCHFQFVYKRLAKNNPCAIKTSKHRKHRKCCA